MRWFHSTQSQCTERQQKGKHTSKFCTVKSHKYLIWKSGHFLGKSMWLKSSIVFDDRKLQIHMCWLMTIAFSISNFIHKWNFQVGALITIAHNRCRELHLEFKIIQSLVYFKRSALHLIDRVVWSSRWGTVIGNSDWCFKNLSGSHFKVERKVVVSRLLPVRILWFF